eukprot:5183497-Prorocentrum_lima.AAC.1
MKILGEVTVPILGVPTAFCVVEGYQGPAILGQNFLCMPGVTLSADELALEGHGSLPLQRYHYSKGLAVAVKAVKGQQSVGPEGKEPIAEDLLIIPTTLDPRDLGVHKYQIAGHSPISWHQLVELMQSPKMAKAWILGFVSSGHDWIVSNCAEPVDELPREHQLLRLLFVLKLKEIDGVQVPHVRPVVTEYHGTGELTDEELYTPGMLHDTWRIVLCIYLSFLVKGIAYSSVLIDFKRAFHKGDVEQAKETWRDIPPFF